MSDTNSPLTFAETGREGASSDRRLFMQLLAFGGVEEVDALVEALRSARVTGALYLDVLDPSGVAVVAAHHDPAYFARNWRALLRQRPFADLTPRPKLTMFGRTYAIGYESDLEETLLHKPIRTLTNADSAWAVWYPLRRKPGFDRLDRETRMNILKEHGGIGRRFAESGAAADIRLACHGLDRADNDFVIGLTGPELTPLSKLVETMRGTDQTANWLQSLGPFFVGHRYWRSAG